MAVGESLQTNSLLETSTIHNAEHKVACEKPLDEIYKGQDKAL
jgi:hypothetical protein